MTDDYSRADEAAKAAVDFVLAHGDRSIPRARLMEVATSAARHEADLSVEWKITDKLGVGSQGWIQGVVWQYFSVATRLIRLVCETYTGGAISTAVKPMKTISLTPSSPPSGGEIEHVIQRVQAPEDPVERLLDCLDKAPGRRGDLMRRANLTDEEWSQMVPLLRADGLITTTGQGRGVTYHKGET